MKSVAASATSVTAVLLNSFGLRVFNRGAYRRFVDPAQLREEQSYHDDEADAPTENDEEREEQEEEEEEEDADDDADADTAGHAARLTVHVTGVHCGSCMERAAGGVHEVEGVVDAHPLPRLGDLAVEYLPSKTDPVAIGERLEQLGFGTRDEESTS